MSQTNTRLDRDTNGRLIRRYKLKGTRKANRLLFTTPSSWVNLKMSRPKRRSERQLCHLILGGLDPDGVAWPVSNNKPHQYYW